MGDIQVRSSNEVSKPINRTIMKAKGISKGKARTLPVALALASLLISTNTPAQPWTLTSAPTNRWTNVASSADGTKLVAVAFFDGIYTSRDSGTTWTKTSAPSNQWMCAVSSTDGVKLAAAPGPSDPIYTSSDSGVTWTPTTVPAANWSGLASSADGTKLSAVGWPSPIYVSSDSGATWTAATAPTNKWYSVAASADGSRLVAIETDFGCRVWTSVDGGDSWSAKSTFNIAFPSPPWISVACSADGMQLLAGIDSSGIFTSKDAGLTWRKAKALPAAYHGAALSADGTRLAVASQGAIYTSTDSGTNWTTTLLHIDPWPSVAFSADGSKLALTANYVGIYVWHQTPALSLSPSANSMVVSWRNLSSAEGFSLETSGSMNAGGCDWAPVTQGVSLTGDSFCVTNSLDAPAAFYRLHKQ